ncbi:aryl-alcohol dehydrogenase AAD14 [Ilyonectria robusta]
MARQFGMALVPWYVLGGGKLQTEKQIEARKQAGEGLRAIRGPYQSEDRRKASNALEEIAEKPGASSIRPVTMAYVMRKTGNVFPLIRGRKVEHLCGNIKALDI